jgi:hypothetical protein
MIFMKGILFIAQNVSGERYKYDHFGCINKGFERINWDMWAMLDSICGWLPRSNTSTFGSNFYVKMLPKDNHSTVQKPAQSSHHLY